MGRNSVAHAANVAGLPSSGALIEALEELRAVVERGRRRLTLFVLIESLAISLAAVLAYLWLVFLLDNTVHLSMWGRVTANLIFCFGCGWLIVRQYRKWRRAQLTEDGVALTIEQRTVGGVENRLINAIQLARETADSGSHMSQAVVEENYRALKQIQLEQAAASAPAIIGSAVAGVVILVGLGFWMTAQDRFVNAARRFFLPLANIEPVYRTRLKVAPGDVRTTAGRDVQITIDIEGRIPPELAIVSDRSAQRMSERLPLDGRNRKVVYTFHAVPRSLTYLVRGGDFTSPQYSIEIPEPLAIEGVRAVYQYPAYTGLADRAVESASGDIEALRGTKAALTFTFATDIDSAQLVLERTQPEANTKDAGKQSAQPTAAPLDLTKRGARTFGAILTLDEEGSYKLVAAVGRRQESSQRFSINVIEDQSPDLELTGVEPGATVLVDSVLPLTVSARDDFGLQAVALSRRSATTEKSSSWREIKLWGLSPTKNELRASHVLPVGILGVVEGESLEIALRARDTDPRKRNRWSVGKPVRLTVTGPGAELQLLYERILRIERELHHLVQGHELLTAQQGEWISKFGVTTDARWDDQKTLAELAKAISGMARSQADLRKQAGSTARDMVDEAGTLKLSVGMLADTEMVRSIRILESVIKRDSPQDKQAALADARLTGERTLRSLHEILDQYVDFREQWELSHMLAFTKMLAERQKGMADASLTYVGLPPDAINADQRRSVGRRQLKLMELATLAQQAFRGMAKRESQVGKLLAEGFSAAADAFDSREVKTRMLQAAAACESGSWVASEPAQRQATADLIAIYTDLRKVQADAARQSLDELQKLAKSDVDVQKEIDKLQAGTDENLIAMRDGMNIEETVVMRKIAEQARRKQERPQDKTFDYLFEERMKGMLTPEFQKGKGQDFNTLSLANRPSGQMSMPKSSDREANKVVAAIQENVKDLVGDLLEEADDLRERYETYNINAAFQTNEPGDVGKQGGDLNSTAASAPTGNMKPPTNNFGGASRTGRQGGRAHGLTVGKESVNRRGRDQVQEGQAEVAPQDGELKQTLSDDPQLDASTGRGGKVVDGLDASFSTKDAEEWKDEDVEKLRPPGAKNQIVERKGKPLDSSIAEMMRDLTSNQEQVIERIKAIQKQLDQLYLPTDHLDDIMKQLAANLDRLKDKPEAEIFRKQAELLDQLKGSVVVFNRPSAQYERSLTRPQTIRGRILDEPAAEALPQYQQAVSRYFEKLSGM